MGGNADDRLDRVFPDLRVWVDANHNGVSEPGELHRLSEYGIIAVSLDYKESRRTDEYGNAFRYRSKIIRATGPSEGRWAWDVYLGTTNVGLPGGPDSNGASCPSR